MTAFDLASDDDRGTLYKLVVARSDFMEALFAARYVIANVHDPGDELWFPLQDAIVVSYARPFTGNRPLGPLAPEWSVFDDPELQRLHEDLVELRHKTIAHSDAVIRRVLIVPPGVKLGAAPTSASGGVAVSTSKLPLGRFPEIERLCLDIGRRVNAAADELIAAMLAGNDMPSVPTDLLTLEPDDGWDVDTAPSG